MALSAVVVALQGVLSLSPLMLAVQGLAEQEAAEVPVVPASPGVMLAATTTRRRRRVLINWPAWHYEEEEALTLSLLRH